MRDINNIKQLMQADIDGALTAEQATRLHAELASDIKLQEEYDALLVLDAELKALMTGADIEPPADFAMQVSSLIAKEPAYGQKVKRSFSWRFAAPAMAAAALLLAVGISGIMPDNRQIPELTTVAAEKTSVIDATGIAAEKTVTAPEPDATTAPVQTVVDDPVGNGSVAMPVPASELITESNGLQVMRFGVEEGDVFSPFTNSMGEIQFYTAYEEQIALCTMTDRTAAVELLEDSDVKKAESFSGDEPCLVRFSPDGTQFAANMGGEDSGLLLSDNNSKDPAVRLSFNGGGNVLEWAPNSGRLVYTDAEGRLMAAYIAEGLVFPVWDGPVYHVLWLSDSCGIVFETVDEKDNRVICKAVLP